MAEGIGTGTSGIIKRPGLETKTGIGIETEVMTEEDNRDWV